MNVKLLQQLRKRKRKLQRRISPEYGKWQSPMIRPAPTKLELSDKQQAVTCRGLAAIIQLIKADGAAERTQCGGKRSEASPDL